MFLLDGFFYIPFALVSILVPAYLGISFLYRAVPGKRLLTVQKYIAAGMCAVVLAFVVSWNTYYSLMTRPTWAVGNLVAMGVLILGGIKIWKLN